MRKILFVLSLIFISPLVFSLEGAKLMALSPSDSTAVVLPAAGELRVVKPGDSLSDGQFNVVQVLVDKLVLRDAKNSDMVWLLKSVDQQASEIKRFSTILEQDQVQTLWDTIIEKIK